MTDIYHLGVDASTTGAGAVLLGPDDEIVKAWCWQSEDKASEDERLRDLRHWFAMLTVEVDQVDGFISCAIERAFARGAASVALAGAEWIVRTTYDTEWTAFPPQTVKATAHQVTGIQTAGIKDLGKGPMLDAFCATVRDAEGYHRMIAEARRVSGTSLGDDLANQKQYIKALGDLVDAYWVAKTDQLAVRAARGEA